MRSTIAPRGAQHALLVVAEAGGSARGQHDLAAVAVDVGLEEGDAVARASPPARCACTRRARRRAPPGPRRAAGRRCRRTGRTPRRSSGARARRSAESRCDRTATGSSPARSTPSDDPRITMGTSSSTGSPASRNAPSFSRADAARAAAAAAVSARDADLVGVGDRLDLGAPARGRPADDELAVDLRVADEEEVEDAAVHADRHPQGDAARPPCRCGRSSSAACASGRRRGRRAARGPRPWKSSSTASPPHFTSPAPSS